MLQKRLDKGFNGFQVPFVPRAARSSRKRSLLQRNVEDDQLCAFDLLATVAGKILLKKESSHLTPPGIDSSYVQDVITENNEIGNHSSVVEHHDKGSVEIAPPSRNLELGIRGLEKDQIVSNGFVSKIDLNGDSHGIEGPEILDGKPPELVSSDCSIKFTLDNDNYPCSSQSPYRDNNVNLVNRDDDENYSECIQPSTVKAARLPTRIGHRKIRKLFASKYWRMASRARDGDLSDTEVRCFFRSRRTAYKRPRSKRIYPFKRRRLYHYSSLSSSYADIGYKGNVSSTHGAGPNTTLSRESHVKLRIKSFHVPELFIEMPGTTTIGSLKRTVMQAVSALLGGGLCVGVLSQGKRIRDDNRTLLQSGICNDTELESLGFSLEPNPSQVNAPASSEENSAVLSSDLPRPVSRCPITNSIDQGITHLSPNFGKCIESDHDSTPSPADISIKKGAVDSRAIVALPEGTPQVLAVVQPHQKTNRPDLCQRRIRRPFSVSEVEALVLAVEQIGTGRWRDVKLRAFDNAEHRTYVDLKDKWKTLVHTARIAPQQRRGEPVPQELLDRVLAAHGYWTQQQDKLHLKQPPSVTCLLL